MPLEIIIDTKKKNGLLSTSRAIKNIEKIDSFSRYIEARPETAKPLSYVEGLKFVRQVLYGGDSSDYTTPSSFDLPVMSGLLKGSKENKTKKDQLNKMLSSYIDSTKQQARISVNMLDIGSAKLPALLSDFDSVAKQTFDTANYKVTFTGGSVTFLEGSTFIIDGLKQSIIWAFLLIALCML
jgi:hypothetical protein